MTVIASVRHVLPLERISSWTIIGAAGGLIADIPRLPSAVSGLLLAFFILVGPGGAVVDFFAEALPKVAVRALIPVVSFSVVVLVVSVSLLLGLWSPRLMLAVLAVLTGAVGVLRLRHHQAPEVQR